MRAWSFDLELAWARAYRQPLQTAAGSWAVAVAVAAVLFVLALGHGLHAYLESRLLRFTPAMWVEAPATAAGRTGEGLEAARNRLDQLTGVTAASLHVEGAVLLTSGRTTIPAQIEGYEPHRLPQVLPDLADSVSGDLPKSPGEVALGRDLADALNVAVGDTIAASGPGGSVELSVAAVIDAGLAAIDARAALVPFETAAALTGRSGQLGFALAVSPETSLEAAREEVQAATGLWARPWYEENRALLEALAVESQVMLWISLAALLTAAVATGAVSLLRVVERRFELGVLQAAGASPVNLVRTVLFETLGTAIAGAAAGALIALSAAEVFKRVRVPLPPRFGLTHLPVDAEWGHLVIAFGSALVAAVFAAVVPAIKAARTDPAEALRTR